MTKGLEITSTWQDVTAALSLAANHRYAVQNVGPSPIETFTASTLPDADAKGFTLAEGEGWSYTQPSDENLYARCRIAPGESYMVFDE